MPPSHRVLLHTNTFGSNFHRNDSILPLQQPNNRPQLNEPLHSAIANVIGDHVKLILGKETKYFTCAGLGNLAHRLLFRRV